MKRASINFFLVLAVCAIALPILIFFALLLMQLEQNENRALENRMGREANSVAASAERLLHDMATSLKLVATSPELLAGDLRSFHNRTRLSLSDSQLFVVLVAEDGRQLLNTRVDYGAPLGRTGNPVALRKVMSTGELAVSDVFVGQTSRTHVFNVMSPLRAIPGIPPTALVVTKDAADLVALLPTDGLPPGWSAAIADGSGNVVASIGPTAIPTGSPLASPLMARMDGMTGVSHFRLGEVNSLAAHSRMQNWAWRAVVWGPVATAQVSILNTWRFLIFGGVALITLAIGAALILARRLEHSVMSIAAMADGLARGEIVSPVTSRIAELDLVGKAISNASFDRSEAEEHIRLIMRELAHRTKNLLTVAQAIIRQTVRQSTSLQEFQLSVDRRLKGLASSIDLLTNENWSGVTLRRLIDTHLATFVDRGGRVSIEGEDFALRPDAVQNLGLAFHELATNAVKYGALSEPGGRVSIAWQWIDSREDTHLELTWTESGGPAVEPPSSTGFGTQVIQRHAAAAFSANVELDFAPQGLRWKLTAPRTALEAEAEPDVVASGLAPA